jgi:hypothetical protein
MMGYPIDVARPFAYFSSFLIVHSNELEEAQLTQALCGCLFIHTRKLLIQVL